MWSSSIGNNHSETNDCSRAARCGNRLSHLARASFIFITKSDGNTAELRRRIAEVNPSAGIIECIHHPLYLEDVFTGQRFGLDLIKDRKVASLSGIAQPESFEQSLVQQGGELVYSQKVRRPPPVHPAGNPQRDQPQQETPGRGHHHDPKRCGALSQAGPARFADLLHAGRNQDPERGQRLPGLRSQNLFSLNHGAALYLVWPASWWPLSRCCR